MIREYLDQIRETETIDKIVLSKPGNKGSEYKKADIRKMQKGYQVARYTEKQVFHQNVKEAELSAVAEEVREASDFRQVNVWTGRNEHIFLISKKGEVNHKTKKVSAGVPKEEFSQTMSAESGKAGGAACFVGKTDHESPKTHNREKQYLIREGQQVAPLVDMGIFTKEGKVVRSMYDKFRQINRFLEILDDEIGKQKAESLNIIDFGCGKSYLTFVVYYYLTEIRHIKARILGLDLKADVIRKCNEAAKKYGYDGLSFEIGDINGYKASFPVDMVITLHACDTATDYALYNAIQWDAKMIFSVPCCQHELNAQIRSEGLSLLTRYGIIKERFAALATDAIRANLLEYAGYKTQILEFIDLEHTPKNLLIRAVKKTMSPKGTREKALQEAEALMEEFHTSQTLHDLLVKKGE